MLARDPLGQKPWFFWQWLSERVRKVYRCLDVYRDRPWLIIGSSIVAFLLHLLSVTPGA